MRIWRRVARALGLHHATTREGVVRRFVTLEVGKPCTDFRLAETERLLRAQPFLASAHVRTVAEPSGGLRVEIETVDEVPAIFDARLRRGQPVAATAGNENIFGRGVRVEVRGERGLELRNGFGATIVHHHFLSRPYMLWLEGQRDPIGGYWTASVGHPFLTDLQRVAWHVGAQGSNLYGALARGEDNVLALGVRRELWDVGGVLRLGPPGQLWLLGGVVTSERTRPAETAIVIGPDGLTPPPTDVRPLPYEGHRATRLNLVTGLRSLEFEQARGLDALTATQDIARGIQIGLIAGHGLPAFGDDDMFAAGNAFVGFGTPKAYFGMQVDGEARRINETGKWEGIIGSGRAALYLKPHTKWTTIASLEGAGGWDVRVPFHLRLDDRQGGIRANIQDDYVGTRRVIARLEQRWIAGPVQGRGDFGLAAFVDRGNLWSGDAPYGRDIESQIAVGIALLAAVPPGSQRMARVDIAIPVAGIASRRVQFRFALADWTRSFWREPADVVRARAGAVLTDIFSWP